MESKVHTERHEEIDWAKGFAILCVLLIHSKPLLDSWVHRYLVDRAVPIFLTLFGMTSEYWWSGNAGLSPRRRLQRWLKSRLRRLMVPVWATVAVWWCVALVLGPSTPVTPFMFLASFMGYAPMIGTFWFVTLIIQWVFLFPFVRWCVVTFGRLPCLVLSLIIAYASHLNCLAVIESVRHLLRDSASADLYYFWIFPPQFLFLIVSGVVIARSPGSRRNWVGLSALLLFLGGAYAHGNLVTDVPLTCSRASVQRFIDVPLTLVLLNFFRLLRPYSRSLRWLAWCGCASWGMYLGQLLTHNSVQLLGMRPHEASSHVRWMYFAFLLIMAFLLVPLGEHARSLTIALTSRWKRTRHNPRTEEPFVRGHDKIE